MRPRRTIVTVSNSYDVLGRLASVTDGEGYITQYAYNGNGTLQSRTAAYNTTDASTTHYDYDLAGRVADVTGREKAVVTHDDPRPGDVLRLSADVTQARTLLGFDPHVELTDGLRRLLDWYRGQPASPEQLLEQELVRNWEARA